MSELYIGDEVVWVNPADLEHFGIKLRKQIAEEEIADRMISRWLTCRAGDDGA